MQNPIAASELIITEKGTVYHLDLAPEHLGDIVITVGDPDRVSEVSKHFDRIEYRAAHREFISHTGYLGAKRITVVGTGIGPDNIDIVMNELDALANIDFKTRLPKEKLRRLDIFRMGTCGSLQAEIDVDSLVVSSHGIGLDNLLHYYQHHNDDAERRILGAFTEHTRLKDTPVNPYIASGSRELLSFFRDGFAEGMTVTCPGFYGPQGRVLRAGIAFEGLIDALGSFETEGIRIANFEMETSAIYGLGGLLGHRCLSINTVVANRIHHTFSTNAPAAIERMIERSLGIIAHIPG